MTAVATTLNYDSPKASNEYYPGTAAAFTVPRDKVHVTVQSARGRESEFSLDKNGFEMHQHTTHDELPDEDREKVAKTYYPEVVELLKQKTGATSVLCIDHLIRRDQYEPVQQWAEKTSAEGNTHASAGGRRVPARFAHVDQSYDGALQWLHDNTTKMLPADEAQRLQNAKRWGIINVWRPLMKGSKVRRDPLGVCDGRTVREEELREVVGKLKEFGEASKGLELKYWMLRRPREWGGEGEGEGKNGEARKAGGVHEWWYWEGMTRDEVLFIKCFDSREDVCRRSPHSAFEDSRYVGDDEATRESIEVRCLVFWE